MPPPSSTPAFILIGGDDFTGTAVDKSKWGVYDGASGSNRWSAADCRVANGLLTMTNGSDGSTCGLAWLKDQTYGEFEVRAKFSPQWAPEFDHTFIAWPQDDNLWRNAEIDFVESSHVDHIGGFVHCTACDGGQLDAGDHPLDLTQWHTYAVQWTPDRISFLIDGQVWFTETSAVSTVPHHLTIQSDYNPTGTTPVQSVENVDWVKIYTYNP